MGSDPRNLVVDLSVTFPYICFVNLTSLSDHSLLQKTLTLAKEERAILSNVLWHLYEIDQRKLYCEEKCGSLYEYCVKVLKYSEGQASRRVTAARLLKTSPEIQVPIQKGEINLTQLGMINSHVQGMEIDSPGEKKKIIAELVGEVKGLSTRETDKVLRDKTDQKPQKVNLKLEQSSIDKLNEVRALKAHVVNNMDDLIEMMSAEVMKQWSPSFVTRKTKAALGKTRYIAVKVREEVRRRDKGRCTNCGSTYGIQFDHIHPFSQGGKTTAENLQLLCRNCNQRKGERNNSFSRPYH
jgi:5-methylcytosine-specific restriction endonuclease McrA